MQNGASLLELVSCPESAPNADVGEPPIATVALVDAQRCFNALPTSALLVSANAASSLDRFRSNPVACSAQRETRL